MIIEPNFLTLDKLHIFVRSELEDIICNAHHVIEFSFLINIALLTKEENNPTYGHQMLENLNLKILLH